MGIISCELEEQYTFFLVLFVFLYCAHDNKNGL